MSAAVFRVSALPARARLQCPWCDEVLLGPKFLEGRLIEPWYIADLLDRHAVWCTARDRGS